MGKYILILILSFGGYVFGQGIEPIQLEASPYKNGLLVAKNKVWSEWLQDSVYIYEHSEAIGGADSTNVTEGWGINVVESPAQTFNVKADTSKLATQYDINGMVTGTGVATRVAFWNGTNSLSSSANLYWDNTNNELEIINIPIGSNASNQLYAGVNAGSGATSAQYSNFFGTSAGSGATGASLSNFFGLYTGYGATSASNSNFFGGSAGNGATNATSSNFFGNSAGYGATNASNSNFFGNNSGYQATAAPNSNFFGNRAGYGATGASFSNFFGYQSGYQATAAPNSNFFGTLAGYGATSASNSNFFGNGAGYGATGASFSNFFGYQSGYQATAAPNSNFFGLYTGYGATSASNSNFFGNGAGYGATNATSSNFFGTLAGYGAINGAFSNVFGANAATNNIGSHNIIIGSGITLADGTSRAMNLGGVLFGTNIANYTSGGNTSPVTGGKIGIMTASPQRELHVTGEARITDLTTDTPTAIVGADADGDLGSIAIGTGLTLSAGTLTATATPADGSETKVTAGTGIGVTGTGTVASPYVVTNTAPDQVVSITGAGINVVSGTYPSFTITGTEVDGSTTNEKITALTWNDAQDSLQVVENGQIYRTKITGFGTGNGTVTSVAATGGTGISVTGSPITTSGTLTITNTGDLDGSNEYIDYVKNYPSYPTQILLGYPYSVISDNSGTTDHSISFPGFSTTSTTGGFVSGSNNQTTKFLRGDNTWQDVGTGTITSVGLSTGTTGTDVNVSGSPLTGSGGTITLNIPSASATARGLVTTGLQTFAGSKTFSYLGGSPVGGNSLIVADVNGKLENLYGAAGVNDKKVPTWNGTAFTLQTPTTGMTSWNLQANSGTTTDITNGENVNFTGSGIASVSRSGNTITVAATEVDGSVTNELDNVTTNLSVSGTSSPLTLNSSDGTDVTFTAGSNITLTGTAGNITIAAASTGLPTGASSQTLAYLGGAWTASSFLKTNSSTTTSGSLKRVDINNDVGGETWPLATNTATKLLVNGRIQSNSTMSGTTSVTLLGRNSDQELGTVTLGSGLAMTGAVLSASTPFFSYKSQSSEYTQTMSASTNTYVTLNMGSGTTQQNSTTVFTNGPVGNTIQVLQDGSYEINYSLSAKATTASEASVTLNISGGASTLNNRKQEMTADKWQMMSSTSIMGLSANDTIGIFIGNSVANNTMTYTDVSLTIKKL